MKDEIKDNKKGVQNDNIQRVLNDINNLFKIPYDSNEFGVKINEIIKYLVENLPQLENLKELYENGIIGNSLVSDTVENTEKKATMHSNNRQVPINLLIPKTPFIPSGGVGSGAVMASYLLKKKAIQEAAEKLILEELLKAEKGHSEKQTKAIGINSLSNIMGAILVRMELQGLLTQQVPVNK